MIFTKSNTLVTYSLCFTRSSYFSNFKECQYQSVIAYKINSLVCENSKIQFTEKKVTTEPLSLPPIEKTTVTTVEKRVKITTPQVILHFYALFSSCTRESKYGSLLNTFSSIQLSRNIVLNEETNIVFVLRDRIFTFHKVPFRSPHVPRRKPRMPMWAVCLAGRSRRSLV